MGSVVAFDGGCDSDSRRGYYDDGAITPCLHCILSQSRICSHLGSLSGSVFRLGLLSTPAQFSASSASTRNDPSSRTRNRCRPCRPSTKRGWFPLNSLRINETGEILLKSLTFPPKLPLRIEDGELLHLAMRTAVQREPPRRRASSLVCGLAALPRRIRRRLRRRFYFLKFVHDPPWEVSPALHPLAWKNRSPLPSNDSRWTVSR